MLLMQLFVLMYISSIIASGTSNMKFALNGGLLLGELL